MNNDMKLDEITLLIKTFNRYECLTKLLVSIRNYYPTVKIVVVDDSDDCQFFYGQDSNIRFVRIKPDSGLSTGRNVGLENIDTKYFVLLDDDFVFTRSTDLLIMHDVISSTQACIVSGGVYDYGKTARRFSGIFKGKKNICYLLEGKNRGYIQGLPKVDFVLNFFIARTSIVKQNKWDGSLKLGEHEDFFLRLSQSDGIIIDASSKFSIDHFPVTNIDYEHYKERVWNYRNLAAKKNGYIRFEKILKKTLRQRLWAYKCWFANQWGNYFEK